MVADWQDSVIGSDRLLGQYFLLAKNNAPDLVLPLLSSVDGSRERFERLLEEFPGYFSNYGALQTLTVSAEAAWGNYLVVVHQLAGGGHSLNWRNTLLCEGSNCILSNALEGNSPSANLGNHLLVFAQAFQRAGLDTAEVQGALNAAAFGPMEGDISPETVAALMAQRGVMG